MDAFPKKPRLSGKAASVFETVGVLIRQANLIPKGETILVAVSGGIDSMALLDVLCRLAPRNEWTVVAAHFNHLLRGRSSDADEQLVTKTASNLGVRLIVERGNVRAFARSQGISIEMAARKLRHEFLARAAGQCGAKRIATAHHADDQAELFFIRLFRGAGGSSLAGMEMSGKSPAAPELTLVRPFLWQTRRAIARYIKARKIKFREDASNRSNDMLRNRIRNELLPLLRKKYASALDVAVVRVMEIARAEGDFLDAAASAWLKSRKPGFWDLHEAVQRRCIYRQLIELGFLPEFDLIERLRRGPNMPVNAVGSEKVRLYLDGQGNVRRSRAKEESAPQHQVLRVNLIGERGGTNLEGFEVRWFISGPPKGASFRKKKPQTIAGIEFFDADAVGNKITLRFWRPGDRFQPIGMPKPVKLQDLFTNAKIPCQLRGKLTVAIDAEGRIFWVEELRISECHKVLNTTTRCLNWAWKRQNPICC